MKASRRLRVSLGAILIALLGLVAILFGPEISRVIRYQYYESIELPDGAGQLSFKVRRGEPGPAGLSPVFTVEPPVQPLFSIDRRAGATPYLRTFLYKDFRLTVLFPGAEEAQRSGRTAVVREDLLRSVSDTTGRESLRALVEERALLYPEIDWEPYRAAARQW